jgi:hypothetical protein
MDKKKINPEVELPLVAKPKAKLSIKPKKVEKQPLRQETWFAS